MGDHKNVAPADAGYVSTGKELENGEGGPVQPGGSSGPTFPAPIGVDPQVLRDAGVGHAYYGVGSGEDAKDDEADDDERPARKQTQARQRSGGAE